MTVSKPKHTVKTLAAKAGLKTKKPKAKASPQVARVPVRVVRSSTMHARVR